MKILAVYVCRTLTALLFINKYHYQNAPLVRRPMHMYEYSLYYRVYLMYLWIVLMLCTMLTYLYSQTNLMYPY